MNRKQLEYFLATAEELHFGRAASRLGLAQPILSRHIKQMEQSLGARLFDRGSHVVVLTQAGQHLYERGKTILSLLDEVKLAVREIGCGVKGVLRIGLVGSATYGAMPHILKSFRHANPDLHLTLVPMSNAQLTKALVTREIDVAIARASLADPQIISKKLASERLVLASPTTLGLALGPVDLAQVRSQPLILFPEFPRPSYADFVLAALAGAGVRLCGEIYAMDLHTALAMVGVGEGVCVVPASVGSASRGGIDYRPTLNLDARTWLSVNHRVDNQSTHVANFVKHALSASRSVRAETAQPDTAGRSSLDKSAA